MGSERPDFMRGNGLMISSRMLTGGKLKTFQGDNLKAVYDRYFLRTRMPLFSGKLLKDCLEVGKPPEQDPGPSVQDITKARIEELNKLLPSEKFNRQCNLKTLKSARYAAPVVTVATGLVFGPLGLAAAALATTYIYFTAKRLAAKAEEKIQKYEAELKTLEIRNSILQP